MLVVGEESPRENTRENEAELILTSSSKCGAKVLTIFLCVYCLSMKNQQYFYRTNGIVTCAFKGTWGIIMVLIMVFWHFPVILFLFF